jgi:hypothetical protein
MASLINHLKLIALNSAINSMDEKELVDVLESFGKKEFGDKHKEYLLKLQYKLAGVVFEMSKRIRG